MAIFLLRQHFKSIPKALAEAAKIDGANTWQTIWGVYMPCAKPAYLSFAVISVSYHWNNYLWPFPIKFNSMPFLLNGYFQRSFLDAGTYKAAHKLFLGN